MRRLLIALVVLVGWPAAAHANPTVQVSSARDGSVKVKHRLTLTAGAAGDVVTVRVNPSVPMTVGGAAQVERPTALTGPSIAICGGRWSARRDPYADVRSPLDFVKLTLAPGATAFVEATVALLAPPRADESLDAVWSVEPAVGAAYEVTSVAPAFRGRLGLTIEMTAFAAPGRHVYVTGTTDPPVSSGRIELWGYAPRATRAHRIARVRVRDGKWSYSGFVASRAGLWELYARYRTGGRTYANDATECGTFVRAR